MVTFDPIPTAPHLMDKPNRGPSTSLLLPYLKGGSKFGTKIGICALVGAVDEEGAGGVYQIFLACHFGWVVSGRPMSLPRLGLGCLRSGGRHFRRVIKGL